MSSPGEATSVYPRSPLAGALDWPGPPLGLLSTVTSARGAQAALVEVPAGAESASSSSGIGRRVLLVRLYGRTVALRSASAHLETLARDLLARGVAPAEATIEVVQGTPPRIEVVRVPGALQGDPETHRLALPLPPVPRAGSDDGGHGGEARLPHARLVGTSRFADLLRAARELLAPAARTAVIAASRGGTVVAWCDAPELPALAAAALAAGARVHAASAVADCQGRFLRDAPALLLPVALVEALPALVPRLLRARFENVGDSSTTLARALAPRVERLVAALLALPDRADRAAMAALEVRALEDVATRLLGSPAGEAIVALEPEPVMLAEPVRTLVPAGAADLLEALR